METDRARLLCPLPPSRAGASSPSGGRRGKGIASLGFGCLSVSACSPTAARKATRLSVRVDAWPVPRGTWPRLCLRGCVQEGTRLIFFVSHIEMLYCLLRSGLGRRRRRVMITMCDYGTSFVYRCVEKNPAKEGVQEERKNYKK